METKIKKWCLKIASLGRVGYFPFGAQFAALLALPVIFILGWIYAMSLLAFCIIFILSFLLAIGAVFSALNFECDCHPGVIVVPNLLGAVIAFMFIPLTIKFIAVGLALFFIMQYLLPHVITRAFGFKPEQWPLWCALLVFDILSGLVVNWFLLFIKWMTY
jgi:hypothetical protein